MACSNMHPIHVYTRAHPADQAVSETSQGTSYSTPYVAGIAAAIYADQPSMYPQRLLRVILCQATKGELRSVRGSAQLPNGQPSRVAHGGIVALGATCDDTAPTPPAPSPPPLDRRPWWQRLG